MRGGAKWQVQHEAKPSAAFTQDFTTSTLFFSIPQVNGVLTDL